MKYRNRNAAIIMQLLPQVSTGFNELWPQKAIGFNAHVNCDYFVRHDLALLLGQQPIGLLSLLRLIIMLIIIIVV